jgi:hypothetical protein
MSTDGTQPPTIAPKKPAAGASVRTADDGPRPMTGPFAPTSSAQATSTAPAGAAAVTSVTPSTTGAPGPSSPSAPDPARRPGAYGPSRPSTQDGQRRETSGVRRTTATSSPSVTSASSGPRRVRLAVARIDPWSVMKLSFLLSFAFGIMIVVAAAVVWYALDGLAVFAKIDELLTTLAPESAFRLAEFVSLKRVVSLGTMIAVVDIVLLTALSTIAAFLYNIVAALVGGIHLTLTDD